MKIIALIHMYPPIHNAGGETTAHSAFRAMVTRGHEVTVLCRPHTTEAQFADYDFEGVKVVRVIQRQNDQQWMRDYVRDFRPDVMITHLDLTFQAMQIALDLDLPLVHLVHNSMQLKFHRVTPLRCQLAVFNSRWVAEAENWQGPQIVLHPVVEPDRYRCEKGTKITLVNPTPGKGADIFYALAKALPDYEFLTVKSVYGEQIAVPNIAAHLHPNVETMEHTADIREAFRKTRVLLMPSAYESYGRVAVEAACCGIPTIANPTPGLRESLGEAGIFRDRAEAGSGAMERAAFHLCVEEWKTEIERLYTDDIYYRSRVDAALRLADSLDPESEYNRLESALISTADTWLRRNEVAKVKMWVSDRRIWETTDGLVAEVNGRIPQNATRLAVGIGGELPEDVAMQYGFIPDTRAKLEAKAIEAPVENKAIASPQENKERKRKSA